MLRGGPWQARRVGFHPTLRRRRPDRAQIDILAQKGRIIGNRPVQIRVLGGLHQPQMPLRQFQVAAPGQGSQNRQPRRLHPQPRQAFMPGAGDTVQDDPCKGQIGRVAGKAQRGRRRTLRLP